MGVVKVHVGWVGMVRVHVGVSEWGWRSYKSHWLSSDFLEKSVGIVIL